MAAGSLAAGLARRLGTAGGGSFLAGPGSVCGASGEADGANHAAAVPSRAGQDRLWFWLYLPAAP